ncbi:MAG TPA: DUF333 domain-containing protein [Anaerolineales bacterium]|nr:DUF333 domain-containing protein [Anaerolineales bacterium]
MKIRILLIGCISILLYACTGLPATPTTGPSADMPNPASAYCVEQGFIPEIRTAADGSQGGVCIFPDGSECDEWAFYRGECLPGEPAVRTPAEATKPVASSTPTSQMLPFDSAWVIPQAVSYPAGVMVDPRNETGEITNGILFYLADGLSLGELHAPNASKFFAAGYYQGSLDFPLVFNSLDLESRVQYISINRGSTPSDPGGQVTNLVAVADQAILTGLVGVPGEPLLFYTDFAPIDANLRTRFTLGNLEDIANAIPILEMESSESRYWEPVAIQMDNNSASGLWFTRLPWGIGGVCAFIPTEGLYYFNLESSTVHEVIPAEHQFTSLSQDQAFAAYTRLENGKPELFLLNLAGGEPLAFPSLPESERGSGDALISPSNRYIAWREAQGCQQEPDFHQRVRVATIDGQMLGEFTDIRLFKTAQIENGNSIDLVGWLDEETILIEVTTLEKPHNSILVKINVLMGESSYFASGFFAGWFYQ